MRGKASPGKADPAQGLQGRLGGVSLAPGAAEDMGAVGVPRSAPSRSCTEHHSFFQTRINPTSAYKFPAGTEGALLIPGASSAFDNISA